MKKLNANKLRDYAKKGNLRGVYACLEQGLLLEGRDNHGYTALMKAARYGKLEVMQMLIAKGADVDARNKKNQSVMAVALESAFNTKNKLAVINLLKARGAKPEGEVTFPYIGHEVFEVMDLASYEASNGKDVLNKEVLLQNVLFSDISDAQKEERIKKLLKDGMYSMTDLAEKLEGQLAPEVCKRIEQYKQVLILKQQDIVLDASLLHAYIEEGNMGGVECCLEEEIHIEALDPRTQWTPLMTAAFYGHIELMELLLQRGAQVHIGGLDNMVKEVAIRSLRATPSVMWLLERKGVALDASILHFYAQKNDVTGVKRCLCKGVEVEALHPRTKWTPLMTAAFYGHVDVMEVLLQQGAKIYTHKALKKSMVKEVVLRSLYASSSVMALLEREGMILDESILRFYAEKKDIEGVKRCLDQGISAKVLSQMVQSNLQHAAISYEKNFVVEALLAQKVGAFKNLAEKDSGIGLFSSVGENEVSCNIQNAEGVRRVGRLVFC